MGGDSARGPSGERGDGRERRAPPKTVYRMALDGTLELVALRTGVTDGAFTEVLSDELSVGDVVVVGVSSENEARSGMTPPPGFGRGGR